MTRQISARRALNATLALASLALLWQLRPPLTDLRLPNPASTWLLLAGEAVYVLVWSAIVIASAAITQRSLHTSSRRSSIRPGSPLWLPPATSRRRTAPIALGSASRPTLTLLPLSDEELTDAAASCRVAEVSHRDAESDNVVRAADALPRLLLLGPVTVSGGRTNRRGLRASALALVVYLGLQRQGASRDELLEAIWPGEDPRKSRGRLYQATRDARRLLGDNAISSEADRYLLHRNLVRVDIDDLQRILDEADGPETLPDEQRERALALFHGDPLAGADYPWVQPHACRLRAIQSRLLLEGGHARIQADPTGAVDFAERGLRIDPLNEDFWQLALRAEAALGLRGAVEARFQTLEQLLDERLGLKPAATTRTLLRQLLGQA